MRARRFVETLPTLDNYWRAPVQLGLNSASYKFALGKALLDIARSDTDFVPLEELAVPYSRELRAHLERHDRQATSSRSLFLEACREANRGVITEDELVEATVRRGFANVLDAFHVVEREPIAVRFFEPATSEGVKGLRLTDELKQLADHEQYGNLSHEAEARWRLVERAWNLRLPSYMVEYDAQTSELVERRNRRRSVTASRPALNGYQKVRCFYCSRSISVEPGTSDLCHIDHFFPHRLKGRGVAEALDGVWNLVLACRSCNGAAGKSGRVPSERLLERLYDRNEAYTASHHPLRETIIAQTGRSPGERRIFLQNVHSGAVALITQRWDPPDVERPAF